MVPNFTQTITKGAVIEKTTGWIYAVEQVWALGRGTV
ncbi:hypothetical protein LIHA111178_02220 [Litorimonas haliclonae]